MEAHPSEDVVMVESKLHPAPSSESVPSNKVAEDASLSSVNGDTFANNNLVSSAPAFDIPPTSSSTEADTTHPTVNGDSHYKGLVNGNQTAISPPTTNSLVSTAPEPSSQPTLPEDAPSASEDITSISAPPAPPVPPVSSASDFPASDTLQVEAHAETDPQSVVESEAPVEQVSAVPEPVTSVIPKPGDTPITPQEAPSQVIPAEDLSLPPSQPLQQETSDLRQSGPPVSLEEAQDLLEEKHQADLAADQELAEGLASGTSDPIDRSLPPVPQAEPQLSETAVEDKMDVTMDVNTNQLEPAADLPHRPQSVTDETIEEPAPEPLLASAPPTTVVPPTLDAPVDQDMTDAPTMGTKVARGRDEDDTQEDGRMAKRSKTEEEDPSSAVEFKVPDLPLGRSDENGAMDDSAVVDSPMTLTTLQHKHLLKAIQTVKRRKDAHPFQKAVDPVALNIPTYFTVITNPMDLGTLEQKLKDNLYRSVAEVVADFDLIASNSHTFNGAEHPVTAQGQTLRKAFQGHLDNLPPVDIVEPTLAEKKAKKAAAQASTKVTTGRRESRSAQIIPRSPATNAGSPTQTFALNPEGVPLIRRDSMAADGRPKREIHPPRNRGLDYGASKPKKKKYAWELKFCQHIWEEIMKPKYQPIASPFYVPVDPVALNIPNYHKVIKKPMDLATIGTKLKHGQYENAKEFEADMRLMLQNCYKFNQHGDFVYTSGKSLEAEFDREMERKKKWISDNAPNSNPQSQGTSPDPEDEDEDEADEEEEEEVEDDNDNQLTILQKQIAAMSKQVEMIQKKKASPPAAAKKSKNKPAKKEKKSAAAASSAPKKKASGKSGKPEKIPYVTYDQKKLISDRINDLSEAKMGQALRIIRENVPALRDVNEEEIELDIDELPNDVLWRLLQFVRQGTSQATDGADEDQRRRAAAASAGPTKPKKNKPMGKHEQEAQISSIQAKLANFNSTGRDDPSAMRSIEQGESSSDDDSGDESEEE